MRIITTVLFFQLISLYALGQTTETVYLNQRDSSTNYFIAFKPLGQPKGLLLLLTSFGETPQIASNETDIAINANKEGLVTIFASLQYLCEKEGKNK